MSYKVIHGRSPGVIEIHYQCALTADMRSAAVEEARVLAGSNMNPVAIVDLREATLAMDVEEARAFHEKFSGHESPDCKLILYAVGDNRAHFEQEVAIGYEFGRMIVLVDSVDDAYAFLDGLKDEN